MQTLRIGVSACRLPEDPERPIFKGKALHYTEQSMAHWLMSEDVLTYIIPIPPSPEFSMEPMIADLDGVVLQGGADVAPESYGEQPMDPAWAGDRIRDVYEIAIAKAALKLNRPLLGICRGAQLMNVALGGTLYQDIATQRPEALIHRNWDIYESNRHAVEFTPGSLLAQVYGNTKKQIVNSVHHQAVKDLAPGLLIEAKCPDDGIIEAFRLHDETRTSDVDAPFAWGIQWHPEFTLPELGLIAKEPILNTFLEQVRLKKAQRV